MKFLSSVIIIILSLFVVVLVKMEIRRVSYELYYSQKELQEAQNEHLRLKIKLAQILQPDHVREHAKALLELDWAKSKQIIYLTGRLAERDLENDQ